MEFLERLRRRRQPNPTVYRDAWDSFVDPDEARQRIYNESDEAVFDEGGRIDAELVRQFLPPQPVVLDVGCGIGRVEKFLAPHCQELHGIDISPRMIEAARARLAEFPQVHLHVNDGRDLRRLGDMTFDVVFSFFVLQHLEREDAFRYLQEIARTIKPSGIALLQFPLVSSTYFDESFRSDVAAGPPYEVARPRLYTVSEAVWLLVKAGMCPQQLLLRGSESIVLSRRCQAGPADFEAIMSMVDTTTAVSLYGLYHPEPSPGEPVFGLRDLALAAGKVPGVEVNAASDRVSLVCRGECFIPLERANSGRLSLHLAYEPPPPDAAPVDLSIGICSQRLPSGWAGPYVQTSDNHPFRLRWRDGEQWGGLEGCIRYDVEAAAGELVVTADGPWLSLYGAKGIAATAHISDPQGGAYLRLVNAHVTLRDLSIRVSKP